MKKIFRVNGLDCANCAAKMENELKKIDGVKNAIVNFMTCKVSLEFEEERKEEILLAVKERILKLEPEIRIEGI